MAGFIASDVIELADILSAAALSQIEGAASRLIPTRRTTRDDTLGRGELLDDVTGQALGREAAFGVCLQAENSQFLILFLGGLAEVVLQDVLSEVRRFRFICVPCEVLSAVAQAVGVVLHKVEIPCNDHGLLLVFVS